MGQSCRLFCKYEYVSSTSATIEESTLSNPLDSLTREPVLVTRPIFLLRDSNLRSKFESPGIPLDSTDNQLSQWIFNGYISYQLDLQAMKQKADESGQPFNLQDKKLRFAIKADANAPYVKVKDVIETFTDKEIYQFQMITSMEEAPAEVKPKK